MSCSFSGISESLRSAPTRPFAAQTRQAQRQPASITISQYDNFAMTGLAVGYANKKFWCLNPMLSEQAASNRRPVRVLRLSPMRLGGGKNQPAPRRGAFWAGGSHYAAAG